VPPFCARRAIVYMFFYLFEGFTKCWILDKEKSML
jgi:hypothetical protein